jgi:hypothetical protein
MSKQGPAETSPQQLRLDLQGPEAVSTRSEAAPKIVTFIDSATRTIRQQAVQRVKAAGIFKVPQSR